MNFNRDMTGGFSSGATNTVAANADMGHHEMTTRSGMGDVPGGHASDRSALGGSQGHARASGGAARSYMHFTGNGARATMQHRPFCK